MAVGGKERCLHQLSRRFGELTIKVLNITVLKDRKRRTHPIVLRYGTQACSSFLAIPVLQQSINVSMFLERQENVVPTIRLPEHFNDLEKLIFLKRYIFLRVKLCLLALEDGTKAG
jgi:hypothetical protein